MSWPRSNHFNFFIHDFHKYMTGILSLVKTDDKIHDSGIIAMWGYHFEVISSPKNRIYIRAFYDSTLQ